MSGYFVCSLANRVTILLFFYRLSGETSFYVTKGSIEVKITVLCNAISLIQSCNYLLLFSCQ